MENIDNPQSDQTIEELQKLADDNLNGWKRCKADLVNYQNEVAKERGELARYGSARILERFLPFADTLSAAASHDESFNDIVRKFDECLKNEGLIEIPAEGKYDPSVHEVIGKEKREGAEADTIVIVAQKGYKLHDKVLRPARVIIAE